MPHRALAALLVLSAMVAYVRTWRLARRSPFYGGGQVVLSWIGLVIQCIGWVAIVQGYRAVNRWAKEYHGGPEAPPAQTRRQYIVWSIIYFCLLGSAYVAVRP